MKKSLKCQTRMMPEMSALLKLLIAAVSVFASAPLLMLSVMFFVPKQF